MEGLEYIGVIDPTKTKEMPLQWAAYLSFKELVSMLLDAKEPIELKNDAGKMALHLAAQNGSLEVTKILLVDLTM